MLRHEVVWNEARVIVTRWYRFVIDDGSRYNLWRLWFEVVSIKVEALKFFEKRLNLYKPKVCTYIFKHSQLLGPFLHQIANLIA